MLLLHVSDVHFRYPICNTPMDPDRPYRTLLVQDARVRAKALGGVDAILVGGDIAYAGSALEYTAAFTWLAELAAACGCRVERIFVVPGNHDVDRSIITTRRSVQNAQQAIIRKDPQHRERELLDQFLDGDAGRALFASIEAYNEFAARFSCQVFSPERLFWQQDLILDDSLTLRIYGLTSTLLSGARIPSGRDDTRGSLYLSPLQTVLDPVDGVVNLVLCHHPPDWFMDHDQVEDAIHGRAAIQLFGHRHLQRIQRDRGYIRFNAGAVNPDRTEVGWEPGYNLVRLTTAEVSGNRYVDVEAHLLLWQTGPDMFRPKLDLGHEEVFRHRLLVRAAARVAPDHADRPGAEIAPEASAPGNDEGTAMGDDERTRSLVFRFWNNLSSSQRREIAERLGLIDAGEMSLSEPERYARVLVRAGKRGLLDRLAAEIEERENR